VRNLKTATSQILLSSQWIHFRTEREWSETIHVTSVLSG